MQLIGLAGPARSGKDTIATHLRKTHGFKVFSFSDALYCEVIEAFGLEDESILRDAQTKDVPQHALSLQYCQSDEFWVVASPRVRPYLDHGGWRIMTAPLSPRFVLQTWGTDYRRAQDPSYWINRAAEIALEHINEVGASDARLVNTSVRYPNEQEWIRSCGGVVWHIRREDAPKVRGHSSEIPVPIIKGDCTIHNNGSINNLWTAATILLGQRGKDAFIEAEEETA
jgi:hypothetical protein